MKMFSSLKKKTIIVSEKQNNLLVFIDTLSSWFIDDI